MVSKCAVCGQEVKVGRGRKLRPHLTSPQDPMSAICPGRDPEKLPPYLPSAWQADVRPAWMATDDENKSSSVRSHSRRERSSLIGDDTSNGAYAPRHAPQVRAHRRYLLLAHRQGLVGVKQWQLVSGQVHVLRFPFRPARLNHGHRLGPAAVLLPQDADAPAGRILQDHQSGELTASRRNPGIPSIAAGSTRPSPQVEQGPGSPSKPIKRRADNLDERRRPSWSPRSPPEAFSDSGSGDPVALVCCRVRLSGKATEG